MEFVDMLGEIFTVCIIPLLGILTKYLISYIEVKIQKVKDETEDAKVDKYLTMLMETITVCVIATNQTYVDTLKKEGKFDLEAQKKAFEMTRDAVMLILTEEAQEYLSSAVGDLNAFISQQIEASVNIEK